MKRLFGYLRRYGRRYLLGGACLLATATLAMTIPWLLKRAVEVIEQDRELSFLSVYVGLIIAFALVQGFARTLSRSLILNIGRDVEYDLRNDLFRHLERLPPGYYQEQQTGDLMSRLVNDIGAVRMMLGPGILNIVNTPIYYLYALGFMLTIDPALTLFSLSAYPVAFLMVQRFSRHLMERTVKVQEGLSDLSARAQENLAGMNVVKAYSLEDSEIERFREMSADFRERSIALAKVRGLVAPAMKMVSNTGILVVLWYGGWLVIDGRIGLGDLVAFMGYLHLLTWPTMALGWMISVIQRGRAAMQRLEQIFSVEPDIVGPPVNGGPAIERGEIELEGVRFAYPARYGPPREVLSGIDLRIAAGETVAIVGRTGSGKTTLVNLVPRLFDVTAGVVRIDGHDVRDLPLPILRGALGVVPQDAFLFSTTLRENISFGLGERSRHDPLVDRAAEVAGLDDDLERFPLGLGTMVGERGITLSGGQKQRVTLARALAFDPRVLILDDALSNVDSETEKKILARLDSELPGRTRILVTHRASTLMGADRILVMDEGRLVEQGSHDALLRKGGTYAEVFRERSAEDELETL